MKNKAPRPNIIVVERKRYIISKEGEESKIGYLFPDNVLYWESKGWKCEEREN